jgi:hypothetical protein
MERSDKDKLFWNELIVAVRNDIWRDATVAMVIVKRELEKSADYVQQNMPDGHIGYSKSKDIGLNYFITSLGASMTITGVIMIRKAYKK